MCGRRTVDWERFLLVANLFSFDFYTDYSRLESMRQARSPGIKLWKRYKRHEPYEDSVPTALLTDENHQLTKYCSLENLLRCFIGRQCTIKHDYIYALLGIARNVDSALWGNELTVDYNMPIEDLFDQVVKFCGLRYQLDGLFVRKLARAMELSEIKMEKVMWKTERINSNVKPDAKQLQIPRSSLEP